MQRFDAAGRLTNETQKVYGSAAGRSIRYEYDAAGRRSKMTYPDGSFVTYQYNANGWLTNILDSGTTPIVIYHFDNGGRRVKRTLENSTFTVYGYDNANQMTSITNRKSDQTVISSYNYGYDDAGQRLWVKRANGKGDVYKYDATDQLTNVFYEATNPDSSPSAVTTHVRYHFDAAGNRTSVVVSNNTGTTTASYTANALNQYEAVGSTYPSYDANGNLMNDGATWLYTYDRENRLVAAEVDGVTTIIYRYDVFNRLISRVKDGTATTRYYYDDQWRLVAEYDGNDNLVAKYVYGPEIDEPVRMARSGTNYYYHAVALGTVTEVTLDDQTVAERYTYDVYGEPVILSSTGSQLSTSAIGNRLLFQGRDRDPDTGFYNFRNRNYSAGLGRFIQADPYRFSSAINLYQFGWNNPARMTDRLGLTEGAWLGGYGDTHYPPECARYQRPWPIVQPTGGGSRAGGLLTLFDPNLFNPSGPSPWASILQACGKNRPLFEPVFRITDWPSERPVMPSCPSPIIISSPPVPPLIPAYPINVNSPPVTVSCPCPY